MRAFWIIGVLHGAVGALFFFLTLHPLRDALDEHALYVVTIASTFETLCGLALMAVAASGARARIASSLIALGALAGCGMAYYIAFTGEHPLDLVAPIGGLAAILGWFLLAFARPEPR